MAVLSIVSLCFIEKRVVWLTGLRLLRALFFLLSIAWLYMVNPAENSNYLLQNYNRTNKLWPTQKCAYIPQWKNVLTIV